MNIKKTLCLGFTFLSLTAQAFSDWDASLDIFGGYRQDRIITNIYAYDPPDELILIDKLKAKHIHVYEVGTSARVLICDNWLIKGFASWGKIHHGKYKEKTEIVADAVESRTKAKIKKGHTRDFLIGAGYLYPVNECLSIGPLVGYAYDYERFKLGKAYTDDLRDPVLDHLKYETRWQGPWIGVEVDYVFDCVRWLVGYEYHRPDWHAKWLLDGPDVFGGAFSDNRKANYAFANVAYLEASMFILDCWDIALEFRYQYFRALNGKEKPLNGSFADLGLGVAEQDKVKKASWQTGEVKLSLGLYF